MIIFSESELYRQVKSFAECGGSDSRRNSLGARFCRGISEDVLLSLLLRGSVIILVGQLSQYKPS